MSTSIIKYYPESSYVSISFAWIKDQRLQGWNSETHFELVILLHNWTELSHEREACFRMVEAWMVNLWQYLKQWVMSDVSTGPKDLDAKG